MTRRNGLAGAAALLGALAVGGCSAEMPSAVAAVNSDADSYFVLGVAPKNMMLQIDEAVIENKKIVRFINVLPLHNYGQSQGPYIVVKAKPGAVLAVHSASIMAGHTIFGILYYPVGETLSFQAPKGKVVYVTDVAYAFQGNTFGAHYESNLQGAKDFIDIHYPALAGKVEQGTYELVSCRSVNCRF